jgi:hypothetical protein
MSQIIDDDIGLPFHFVIYFFNAGPFMDCTL